MGTYYNRIVTSLRELADKIDPAGSSLVEDDTFYDDMPESVERIADHYGSGGGGASGSVLVIDMYNTAKPEADGLSYDDAVDLYVIFDEEAADMKSSDTLGCIMLDPADFSLGVCIDFIGYEGEVPTRFYAISEVRTQVFDASAEYPEFPGGESLALANDVMIYDIVCLDSANYAKHVYVFPVTSQFIRVSGREVS